MNERKDEDSGDEGNEEKEIKNEERCSEEELEDHIQTGKEDKSEEEFRGMARKVKEEFSEQCEGRFEAGCGHGYDKEHSPRDFDYFENIRTSSIAALRRRAKEHEVLLTSQNSMI